MRDYLCKNCKYNNNGFCEIYKTGGLKQNNIQQCKFYNIRECFDFRPTRKIKIKRIKKVTLKEL